MAKFFAVLSGLIGFGLLALFFMFLGWKDEGKAAKKLIASSVDYYSNYWQNRSGGFSIQYDSMDLGGFPFDHEIKIFQPRVQFTASDEIIQLSSLVVTFLPVEIKKGEKSFWQYKVEFPLEVVVGVRRRGEQQRNFTLHLSEVPGIYLQSISSIRGGNFDEYGVLLPEKLMITVNHGEVTRTHNFSFVKMEAPFWRYIPTDIHGMTLNFIHMMEDSLASPAP